MAEGRTQSDTFRKRLRTEPFFNTTSETIPPFACMMTQTQIQRGDQVVWPVSKADAATYFGTPTRMFYSRFMFNTEKPCPRRTFGEGTFDFPCRALFLPTSPTTRFPFGIEFGPDTSAGTTTGQGGEQQPFPFGGGSQCGPVANQWYLATPASEAADSFAKTTLAAFTCRIPDTRLPLGQSSPLKTIWVTPTAVGFSQQAFGRVITSPGGGGTISASGLLTFHAPQSPSRNVFVTSANNFNSSGTGQVVRVGIYGLYMFGFSATISSPTAPRGAPLTLQITRQNNSNGKDNSAPVISYTAMRQQDIERDVYYIDEFTTAENVAVSGFQFLAPNQGLTIRNTSGHSISIQAGTFHLVKAGEHQLNL